MFDKCIQRSIQKHGVGILHEPDKIFQHMNDWDGIPYEPTNCVYTSRYTIDCCIADEYGNAHHSFGSLCNYIRKWTRRKIDDQTIAKHIVEFDPILRMYASDKQKQPTRETT